MAESINYGGCQCCGASACCLCSALGATLTITESPCGFFDGVDVPLEIVTSGLPYNVDCLARAGSSVLNTYDITSLVDINGLIAHQVANSPTGSNQTHIAGTGACRLYFYVSCETGGSFSAYLYLMLEYEVNEYYPASNVTQWRNIQARMAGGCPAYWEDNDLCSIQQSCCPFAISIDAMGSTLADLDDEDVLACLGSWNLLITGTRTACTETGGGE